MKISDHALIGDRETTALVRNDGVITWLCWPRYDSSACFCALLGDDKNGFWALSPAGSSAASSRRYIEDTLVLETTFSSAEGECKLIDFMPLREGERSELVRIVVGVRGEVPMRMRLSPRFDYGRLPPWFMPAQDGPVQMLCGPHRLEVRSPFELRCEQHECRGEFVIRAGERKAFMLRYQPALSKPLDWPDPEQALGDTTAYWQDWVSHCQYRGRWREAVVRSLITMKAMAYRHSGGIIAAPTTSLPESLGGKRNWDYRFCWLRDATFTLLALMHTGYQAEAEHWRDWLSRAVAGAPDQVQPLYGVEGEHQVHEWEVKWLPGYRHSTPVRIGNGAESQLQIDVYGEILDALYQAREHSIPPADWCWKLQYELVEHLASIWSTPDAGFWEARHGGEHFTQSRVMAWAAFDRAVRAAEKYHLDWPLDEWRRQRDAIHAEVCARGYDAGQNAFVRSYETHTADASTLTIPLVGFLPADDPRMLGTVRLIERELMQDGLVWRYDTRKSPDGLPPGEGAFLACGFWYVDNLILQGRKSEGVAAFERLLALRNDVGLLSEEYDPHAGELVGNFPQALSHLSLVNSACNMESEQGPAHRRSAR